VLHGWSHVTKTGCVGSCRLRWVKSASELALMRTSACIAAHAQRRCIQMSHAGVHERALATEFEYSVKMAGASRLAYPTMAGGGADTCTIHYSRNDKRVSFSACLFCCCKGCCMIGKG
jgi:Xaa-Pro aminopeptidase